MLKNTALLNKLDWIKRMNPLTMGAIARYKGCAYTGIRLGYVAHIEPKMIPHIEFFIKNGVEVHVAPCVPCIKDTESFEYLKSIGAMIYGVNSTNWEELNLAWSQILQANANYLFDMGGGIIAEAIKYNTPILAAAEATSSGISKISQLRPPFPVFDWNNIPLKNLMHNRYETGSGIWFAFRNLTGLDPCRMKIGVLGFGMVGQSVASTARGLGARVYVHDIDPVRNLAAASEGYFTDNLETIMANVDVIVTATGMINALNIDSIAMAKNNVIILNAGHDNREINLNGANFKNDVLPQVSLFTTKEGKEFYLLANGLLLNLAAGGGSAVNTFDLCTALMTEVISYILTSGKDQPMGLHPTPQFLVDNILKGVINELNLN